MKPWNLFRADAQVLQVLRASMSRPLLLLWLGYLMGSPFYVFRSGTAQPADFAMVLLAGLVWLAAGQRLGLTRHAPVRHLGAFVIWVTIVAWFWWGMGVEIAGRQSIYYIYNFVVFVTVLGLYVLYRRLFLLLTAYGYGLSLIFQSLLSRVTQPKVSDLGYVLRETLFFNNPNQLGYFSLLGAATLAIGLRFLRLSTLWTGAGFLCSIYLTMLSLSKAAMFSILLLAAATLVRRVSLLFGVSVLLLVGFLSMDELPNFVERAAARIQSTGAQSDDNAEARGYDRIVNHPEYWIFGAGEGGWERFDTILEGEIHSTPGTIFFCYGLIGTAFVLLFLWTLMRGTGWTTWLLVLPIFLYGLTHNGLRFTHMWIAFAFLYCVIAEERLRQPMRHLARVGPPSKPPLRGVTAVRSSSLRQP